jgi:hypothetical protein
MRERVAISLVALAALAWSAQTASSPKSGGYKAQGPESAPPQPLPFSHRVHASAAALACKDCHASATKEDTAGIPQTKQCMACHIAVSKESPPIRELARFYSEQKRVPWVRVYRVPDFVFFSHVNHTSAGIACADCHGEVAKRDVLYREIGTDMDTCVKCHVARGTSKDCALCHQLGH